jgi:serine protease Do
VVLHPQAADAGDTTKGVQTMKRGLVTLILVLGLLPARPMLAQNSVALQALQDFSDGMAELAGQAKPSVVAIKTEIVTEATTMGNPFRNPFMGTPFEELFGRNHPGMGGRGEERHPGLGSGVIVSRDGYILTNNHVVTGTDRETVAQRITVELLDKRSFTAKVVGRDPLSDLAVLKIEATALPALPFGDSDKLRVGEVVVAVGNPFGQLHTVTTGIVSAVGRGYMGLAEYEDFVQTDAAINPGNSGGALVNTRGQLVAINTAIIGSGSRLDGNVGSAGVGFAIPANMARKVMQQLIDSGTVHRALLGVMIQPVSKEVAAAINLGAPRGVLVGRVDKGSAAETAGIQRGDVIVSVDGEAVNEVNVLRNRIAMTKPGTEARIGVWRDGTERTYAVKLGERTAGAVAAAADKDSDTEVVGLKVQELTADIASRLGYTGQSGALVSAVNPGSAAQRAGLQRGDLIQEVDRHAVATVADFNRLMAAGANREANLLLVRRGEDTVFVALPRGEE